jgi:hypothetical protein
MGVILARPYRATGHRRDAQGGALGWYGSGRWPWASDRNGRERGHSCPLIRLPDRGPSNECVAEMRDEEQEHEQEQQRVREAPRVLCGVSEGGGSFPEVRCGQERPRSLSGRRSQLHPDAD